jgi:hypothetical protein
MSVIFTQNYFVGEVVGQECIQLNFYKLIDVGISRKGNSGGIIC